MTPELYREQKAEGLPPRLHQITSYIFSNKNMLTQLSVYIIPVGTICITPNSNDRPYFTTTKTNNVNVRNRENGNICLYIAFY